MDGHLNAEKYISLLSEHFVPFYEEKLRIDTIFQQDNAPAHRSATVKLFQDQYMPEIFPWPAQSPDMNIIENVWHFMKQQLRKRKSKNLTELRKNILDIWQKIPVSYLQQLFNNMPNRIKALKRSRGYPTKY